MTYDHRVKINGTWVEPGAAYTAPTKLKNTEKETDTENRSRMVDQSAPRSKRKLDVD